MLSSFPKRATLFAAGLLVVSSIHATAQVSQNLQNWMQRINSGEFNGGGGRGGRGGGGGGRGGRAGGPGRWVEGGKAYIVAEGNQPVRIETATGARTEMPAEPSYKPPQLDRALTGGVSSADGKKMLFATAGHTVMIRKTANDYWVLDKSDNSWRKLGGQATGLLFAKFSPDGSRVAYLGDPHQAKGAEPKYNLWTEEVRGGAMIQLTTDASEDIINGTSDWNNNEEFGLADCFQWSPDGKYIYYYQFDQSGVPEFALINYTDELYPKITKYKYPKPGQTNSAVRVGVIPSTGGATKWLKTPGDSRNTYIPHVEWTLEGDVILQHMNRLQNTNTVYLGNPATGDLKQMFQDKDEKAWVEVNRNLRWIEDGKRLLFTSERDGWRHLYAVSKDGNARLITNAQFDMVSLSLVDEAGGWVYFIASPENATQRYLYRSRVDGTKTERLTPASEPGTHTYTISPDAKWAFHSVSSFTSPGQSDLISLPDHKLVRVMNDNAAVKAQVGPILAGRTEMVHIPVGHDTTIDGWLIRPTKFDPTKKYPIIVTVYGEPAASTVNDSWGGNGRLLLAALADDGYLIASFDNSGTPAPKGRNWRKVIYGSVGVLASQEQADALRGLAQTHPYVDLTRVGVYGWSGGGSMTLNLMFRSPDLYSVGFAGAPVPDQSLYDSIYQERYMGLPDANAKGYRDGSPITFAEGLKGKLMIVHGSGDDNVHFQGTQRLLNKLISLNKQFHFMEYPNRRHGVQGSDPVHLDNLRYGFFEEYLPAGPR